MHVVILIAISALLETLLPPPLDHRLTLVRHFCYFLCSQSLPFHSLYFPRCNHALSLANQFVICIISRIICTLYHSFRLNPNIPISSFVLSFSLYLPITADQMAFSTFNKAFAFETNVWWLQCKKRSVDVLPTTTVQFTVHSTESRD